MPRAPDGEVPQPVEVDMLGFDSGTHLDDVEGRAVGQLDLFSHGPSEPTVAQAEQERRAEGKGAPVDENRTATQREKILAMLRQGTVSNFELAEVCIRYSARIHELRNAGHAIETVSKIPGKDKNSALVLYRLKEGT